jgi:hypothetical protein
VAVAKGKVPPPPIPLCDAAAIEAMAGRRPKVHTRTVDLSLWP